MADARQYIGKSNTTVTGEYEFTVMEDLDIEIKDEHGNHVDYVSPNEEDYDAYLSAIVISNK